MRITFREVNQNLQYHIGQNYSKLTELQEQIATGKRLMRPSDDPVDISNDLELRGKLKALHQYHRNINDGMAFMGVTDTALVSMNDLMQRTRELGIQGSNDMFTAEQRTYVAREVTQLLRQMVSIVDTTYKGEYVFGGTNSQIPPYTIESATFSHTIGGITPPPGTAQSLEDTSVTPPITNIENVVPGTVVVTSGGNTYQENVDFTIDYVNGTITRIPGGLMAALGAGNTFEVDFEWVRKAPEANTDAIRREVEENVTPRINISADEVIIDRAANVDVIQDMIAMAQNLLQNDAPTLRTTMANLEVGFENILSAQATNGSRLNRFEKTLGRNETQNVDITRLQTDLEDADLAEIITEFTLLENVYSASLKAGARIIQPSLVDFLR